jgi:hypothetical protein
MFFSIFTSRGIYSYIIVALAAVCVGMGAPAKAQEVFYWSDPHTEFSVTFPDEWRQISNQKPDDVLTIAAPGTDNAECRLRRREDRRSVIYPRDFAPEVQRTSYSIDFWEKYLGEYDNAVVNAGRDNAGLGKGFASYADASYLAVVGPRVPMRGIMLGGVYNDKSYIFECSAAHAAFDQWHPYFLSILKSVDFRAEYSNRTNGYYRPFQNDPDIRIRNARPMDTYIY